MPLGRVFSGAAPTTCGKCRTPFQASVVTGRKRKRRNSDLCPRCVRVGKAEKRKKKVNP